MAVTETKQRRSSGSIGCVAIVALWFVLLLHFFADRIWDKEPAVLKWAVIGYGCLVLLSLLVSLTFGKRDEKIIALVILAIVALVLALIPRSEDREAAAAVDAFVREISEKGAAIESRTDSLPEIPDKPARGELEQYLLQAIVHLNEQSESSNGLVARAEELFPRVSGDKRRQLRQAIEQYNQQAGRAREKRDLWIKQVREKIAAQKKASESK